MSELIDRDALKNAIHDEFDGVCVYDVSGTEVERDMEYIIDRVQTVDAVPVVRCVNCQHCDYDVIVQKLKNGTERRINICLKHQSTVADDYFCADGERRKSNE